MDTNVLITLIHGIHQDLMKLGEQVLQTDPHTGACIQSFSHDLIARLCAATTEVKKRHLAGESSVALAIRHSRRIRGEIDLDLSYQSLFPVEPGETFFGDGSWQHPYLDKLRHLTALYRLGELKQDDGTIVYTYRHNYWKTELIIDLVHLSIRWVVACEYEPFDHLMTAREIGLTNAYLDNLLLQTIEHKRLPSVPEPIPEETVKDLVLSRLSESARLYGQVFYLQFGEHNVAVEVRENAVFARGPLVNETWGKLIPIYQHRFYEAIKKQQE